MRWPITIAAAESCPAHTCDTATTLTRLGFPVAHRTSMGAPLHRLITSIPQLPNQVLVEDPRHGLPGAPLVRGRERLRGRSSPWSPATMVSPNCHRSRPLPPPVPFHPPRDVDLPDTAGRVASVARLSSPVDHVGGNVALSQSLLLLIDNTTNHLYNCRLRRRASRAIRQHGTEKRRAEWRSTSCPATRPVR